MFMNIPTYFLNEVSLVLFRSSALIARLALPRDTLGANKLLKATSRHFFKNKYVEKRLIMS